MKDIDFGGLIWHMPTGIRRSTDFTQLLHNLKSMSSSRSDLCAIFFWHFVCFPLWRIWKVQFSKSEYFAIVLIVFCRFYENVTYFGYIYWEVSAPGIVFSFGSPDLALKLHFAVELHNFCFILGSISVEKVINWSISRDRVQCFDIFDLGSIDFNSLASESTLYLLKDRSFTMGVVYYVSRVSFVIIEMTSASICLFKSNLDCQILI